MHLPLSELLCLYLTYYSCSLYFSTDLNFLFLTFNEKLCIRAPSKVAFNLPNLKETEARMTRDPLSPVPSPELVPILAKPTNPPAPQGHLFLLGLQWVPTYQPFFIGEI
jgi:hypothetical protein